MNKILNLIAQVLFKNELKTFLPNIAIERIILFASLFFLFFGANSYSQERNYLSLSAAIFDVIQQVDPAFESRVEFRFGKTDLIAHPFTGVMVNTGGAAYIYFGLYYDFPIGNRFLFTPSFAPGLYAKSRSKELNFVLEFRTQIEFFYVFDSGSRIGVGFYHMSNASLGNDNPGVESLSLSYVFPF